MMVGATKETLELHGSPELGYYVALAIGDNRDYVVSMLSTLILANQITVQLPSGHWQ